MSYQVIFQLMHSNQISLHHIFAARLLFMHGFLVARMAESAFNGIALEIHEKHPFQRRWVVVYLYTVCYMYDSHTVCVCMFLNSKFSAILFVTLKI